MAEDGGCSGEGKIAYYHLHDSVFKMRCTGKNAETILTLDKEEAGKTGGYRANCKQKWGLTADYAVIKSCRVLNEIDIPDIGSGWAT